MIFLPPHSWEVKKANGKGKGLFTKKNITPGTIIGDYTGKIVKYATFDIKEDATNLYLMYYNDTVGIYPDITKPDLHTINHSCMPNCWVYVYQGHSLFFALRKIFRGEELTISYMLSPQDTLCKPCFHTCDCETAICTGSMHLSKKRYINWRTFQDQQAKQTNRLRVKVGEELPVLSSYPKSIPDNPIYDLFGNGNQIAKKVNDATLPPLKDIRKLIRETGRVLFYPKLNVRTIEEWIAS